MELGHVLLVTYPLQGHINPAIQFANRLISLGIQVTFATSVYGHRRMVKSGSGHSPSGLRFATFSDGHGDGGSKPADVDAEEYLREMRSQGSRVLRDAIAAAVEDGRPFTYVVYTILLPWVAKVAHEFHIPNAMLWIQPATVLDVYYHYFHGFGDEIAKKVSPADPSWRIQMPGIPVLSKRDLPSFMLPSSTGTNRFVLELFKEQLDGLDAEERPKVLVNTFDALEVDALKAIDEYDLIGVGPLIPSTFLEDLKDPSDNSSLFQNPDNDYVEWMNSKPESSVVYVSFGSILRPSIAQMKEIRKGLVDCGRPFLWVIRANEEGDDQYEYNEELRRSEELGMVGKIVPWCSQLEVLRHPSLGCFVTHCGWNSTLESISCGIPVVAFPHWSDQPTTGKLIEDAWRTGVRVIGGGDGDGDGDGDAVVASGEIKRCIEEVMDGGDKSKGLRESAHKWKRLAREAIDDNGSSTVNLKAFFQASGAVGC